MRTIKDLSRAFLFSLFMSLLFCCGGQEDQDYKERNKIEGLLFDADFSASEPGGNGKIFEVIYDISLELLSEPGGNGKTLLYPVGIGIDSVSLLCGSMEPDFTVIVKIGPGYLNPHAEYLVENPCLGILKIVYSEDDGSLALEMEAGKDQYILVYEEEKKEDMIVIGPILVDY